MFFNILIAGLIGGGLSAGVVFGGVQMTKPAGGNPEPAGDSIVQYSDS